MIWEHCALCQPLSYLELSTSPIVQLIRTRYPQTVILTVLRNASILSPYSIVSLCIFIRCPLRPISLPSTVHVNDLSSFTLYVVDGINVSWRPRSTIQLGPRSLNELKSSGPLDVSRRRRAVRFPYSVTSFNPNIQ